MADLHEQEENMEVQGEQELNYEDEVHEEESLDPQIKKWIGIIAAIIVVAFLAIYGIQYMNQQEELETVEGSQRLIRVQQLMTEGKFDEALAGTSEVMRGNEPIMGYEDIAVKYSGVEAGRTAALNAAKIHLEKSNYDEAGKYYQMAMDTDNSLTLMGAKAGMAAVKEQAGDNSSAASLYADAANLATATNLKQKYTYFAGLNYSLAGDEDKAKNTLDKAVKLSPGSQWANMARAELGLLGTEIAQ